MPLYIYWPQNSLTFLLSLSQSLSSSLPLSLDADRAAAAPGASGRGGCGRLSPPPPPPIAAGSHREALAATDGAPGLRCGVGHGTQRCPSPSMVPHERASPVAAGVPPTPCCLLAPVNVCFCAPRNPSLSLPLPPSLQSTAAWARGAVTESCRCALFRCLLLLD